MYRNIITIYTLVNTSIACMHVRFGTVSKIQDFENETISHIWIIMWLDLALLHEHF